MAGLRWPPEVGNDQGQTRADVARPGDVDASHNSDDERSVAADSWSVKSEYGSTLDGDDLRQSDSVDAMAAANFRPTDYRCGQLPFCAALVAQHLQHCGTHTILCLFTESELKRVVRGLLEISLQK